MAALKTLSNLFDRLRKQKAEEAQTAEELYLRLVIDVADGKEPTIDEIMPVLADAGQSPEGLERDVTRLLNRREWSAIVAAEPDLRDQQTKIVSKIDAQREKFRKERNEHEAVIEGLNNESTAIQAKLDACLNAQVKLHETADPSIARESTQFGQDAIDPLRTKLDQLGRQKERLYWDSLAAMREHETGETERFERGVITGRKQPTPALDRHAALQTRYAEVAAEIKQTTADIKKAEQEQQAINRRAFTP